MWKFLVLLERRRLIWVALFSQEDVVPVVLDFSLGRCVVVWYSLKLEMLEKELVEI